MTNAQSMHSAEIPVVVPEDTGSPEKSKEDDSVGLVTVVADLGKSFVQSAVINPVWNGLGQLVSLGALPQISIDNPENAAKSSVDNWAQKIGCALGVAADFYLLTKFKCRIFGGALSAEKAKTLPFASRAFTTAKESAKLGVFYGAVLTPSQADQGLLWGRVANAGAEAITFAALGGGATALGGLKTFGKIKPNTLANTVSDMGIAGAAGVPAGAAGAVAHATFNGRPLSAQDIKESAVDFGIIGFALAGITHGAAALKPGVRSGNSADAPETTKGRADEVLKTPNQEKAAISDTAQVDSLFYEYKASDLRDTYRAVEKQFPSEAWRKSDYGQDMTPRWKMISDKWGDLPPWTDSCSFNPIP